MKAIYKGGKVFSGSQANCEKIAWQNAIDILIDSWGMTNKAAKKFLCGCYCDNF